MPGKSWKCRGCGQYNRKTDVICTGCGDRMMVLTGGGSSSHNPEHSYDNIPPRGYGDGYGGYGTYGASSYGKGKGWHPHPDYGEELYTWSQEHGRSYGPPPRPQHPPADHRQDHFTMQALMVSKEVDPRMAITTSCRHPLAQAARLSIHCDRREVAKRKARASRTQSMETARMDLLYRHLQLSNEDGQQGRQGERQVAPGPMPDP